MPSWRWWLLPATLVVVVTAAVAYAAASQGSVCLLLTDAVRPDVQLYRLCGGAPVLPDWRTPVLPDGNPMILQHTGGETDGTTGQSVGQKASTDRRRKSERKRTSKAVARVSL